MEKIGDKIYNLRLQCNLSQEQLGEKVEVTRQTVSAWEANRRQVNIDKLELLCGIFGVTLAYFLTDQSIDTEKAISKDEEVEGVCADLEQEAQSEERPLKGRKRLSPICKTLIAILVLLLIGVVILIIDKVVMSPIKGFDRYTDTIYNFDIKEICTFVFGIAIALAVLLTIKLIIIYVKRKKEKKKINIEVENDKN